MNSTRTITLASLTLLLLAVLSTAGCSGAAPRPPDGPPGITGTIVTAQRSAGAYGASQLVLLVEGGQQPAGAVSDKASVTVTEDTDVFDSAGSRSTSDALAQGQLVEVWFEGPVAESYPVQGTASAIRILE